MGALAALTALIDGTKTLMATADDRFVIVSYTSLSSWSILGTVDFKKKKLILQQNGKTCLAIYKPITFSFCILAIWHRKLLSSDIHLEF